MVFHNPWETEDRADLVSIGSHRLYVSSSGRPRKHGAAVIVFLTGGGMPAVAYVRLQRLLSRRHRVIFYDRSGYDKSERGKSTSLLAEDAAAELAELLERMAVRPPYVLIGHSYGCIIAREFLARTRDAVVGMMLAEAATELMYQAFPKIPDPALAAIVEGIDFAELTNLREQSQLTDEEWNALVKAVERTEAAAESEDNHASGLQLAQKEQFRRQALDTRPLCVIRCSMAKDFEVWYQAGVRKRQGTNEQRAQAKSFIERLGYFEDELKASQLRLSSNHRYVEYLNHGHDDLLRRPESVTTHVDWIMEQCNSISD